MSKLLKKAILLLCFLVVVLGVRLEKVFAESKPFLLKDEKNIGNGYTYWYNHDLANPQEESVKNQYTIKKGDYDIILKTTGPYKDEVYYDIYLTKMTITDKNGRLVYEGNCGTQGTIDEIVVGKKHMYYTVKCFGGYELWKIDFNNGRRKKLRAEWGFRFVFYGKKIKDVMYLKNRSGDGDGGGFTINIKTDKMKDYTYLTSDDKYIYSAVRKGKYLEIYKANLDFSNDKHLGDIKFENNIMGLVKADSKFLYCYTSSAEKASKIKLISKADRTKFQVKGLSKEVRKEYAKILKKHIKMKKERKNLMQQDFGFVDINRDGRKELIVIDYYLWGRIYTSIYQYKSNKIVNFKDIKSKVYNGKLNKVYKNYIMSTEEWGSDSGIDYGYDENVYDINAKKGFEEIYSYKSSVYDPAVGGLEGKRKESITYKKLVGNEMKKISKKEYEEFVSKFKEIKFDFSLKDLKTSNIEKYVSE